MVINARQTPFSVTIDGLNVPVHGTTFHGPASSANIWVFLPIGYRGPGKGGKVASLREATIWYTLKETILWKQSFFCCQKVNACIHGQSAHKNTSGHLSFQSSSPQFHPLWWLLGPLLLGWLSWSKGCRKGQKCSS